MRELHRGTLAVVGLLAAIFVVAPSAAAYWRSAGHSPGAASTGTLAPPTGVTVATSSTSSVLVSWTASAGSPVPTGYYVTRTTGGTTAAACGSSANALIPAPSCTDVGVAAGSYTYAVTAVYHSWSAAGTPSGTVAVAAATKVVITAQPSNAAATATITPALAVTVETAAGVPVPVAGTSVSVAIGTNPSSGTLSGTHTALTNASGVATFAGLSIDRVGTGYTLIASSSGLTAATSTAFTISVGTATQLVVTTSPTNSFVGQPFFTQPVVTFEDAGGNVATTNVGSVALAITTPAGATLTCSANPRTVVAGVATFTGCSINTVGTYTLTATSTSVTSAATAAFTVVATPTKLAWTGFSSLVCATPPSGTAFALTYINCGILGTSRFTSSVSMTDAAGNPVVNLGADVTVNLTAAHGSVSSTTVTIGHGQSASSTTSTFNPTFPLLVSPDTLTASAAGAGYALASATATLRPVL